MKLPREKWKSRILNKLICKLTYTICLWNNLVDEICNYSGLGTVVIVIAIIIHGRMSRDTSVRFHAHIINSVCILCARGARTFPFAVSFQTLLIRMIALGLFGHFDAVQFLQSLPRILDGFGSCRSRRTGWFSFVIYNENILFFYCVMKP